MVTTINQEGGAGIERLDAIDGISRCAGSRFAIGQHQGAAMHIGAARVVVAVHTVVGQDGRAAAVDGQTVGAVEADGDHIAARVGSDGRGHAVQS